MIKRIKQFIKGILSYTKNIELAYIDRYLNRDEKTIFLKLPLHEQQHAISTAKIIESFGPIDDADILLKAALLHDIGKVNENIGIIKKSILVLSDKLFPKLSRKISNKIRMFYIYYNHPEIGAKLLSRIGTESKVISLVKYHHSNKVSFYGLDILKKADDMN